MTAIVQHLVDAVSTGSTYALLGLGLTLVFSVMNLVNFAYGMLIVWGGYALSTVTDAGAPYWVGALTLFAAVVALSWLMGVVAFRPFRHAPPATLLLTSFGVGLILQALASATFGDTPRLVLAPSVLGRTFRVGGVVVNVLQIVTVVAGGLVLSALHVLLHRTTLGLHIRASAEDPVTARLLGIRSERVLATVFVISGAVTAVVALLWLAKTGTVGPRTDLSPTLKAFIVVVIGGLGTIRGAVIGGLLLGAFESFLTAYLPSSWTNYQTSMVFVILMVLLLVRPQGIVGKTVELSK